MNPGRFYVPRIGMRMNPMFSSNYLPSRGSGLFGSIKNSIRGINFSGILNGANKTLNVVNQTIPLVRQARPMFNNMRSILQLAKAFGSETNSNKTKYYNNQKNILDNKNTKENVNTTSNKDFLFQKKETTNSNYPSFFI